MKKVLRTFLSDSRHVSSCGLLLFAAASCWGGGAGEPQPLAVAIRPAQTVVALVSNPQGLSFSVPVIVRNNGSRTLVVAGCGPAAERTISGEWETVFSPACMEELVWKIGANDSTIIPVTLYGYTAVGMLPRIDPEKAQPGTYRLVFTVGAQDPGDGTLAPSRMQKVASASFTLSK